MRSRGYFAKNVAALIFTHNDVLLKEMWAGFLYEKKNKESLTIMDLGIEIWERQHEMPGMYSKLILIEGHEVANFAERDGQPRTDGGPLYTGF